MDLLSTTNIVVTTDHGSTTFAGKNWGAVTDYVDGNSVAMMVS